MAFQLSDPRYGFSFKTAGSTGKNSTKSINNVNLAMGGASEGYTPEEVGIFIDAICDSVMAATTKSDYIINAQRLLDVVP